MNEIESGDFMWIEFEIMDVVDPLQIFVLGVIMLFEFFGWLMCFTFSVTMSYHVA